MDITLLDPTLPAWNAALDHIGAQLGVPDNPTVFPYHFLQVVLPRLGGGIVTFQHDGVRYGVGFLFPRGLQPAGTGYRRQITLRYHSLPEAPVPASFSLAAAAEQTGHLLGDAQVIPYDPLAAHRFAHAAASSDPITIGRPSAVEAEGVRDLHRRVWGSPREYLYPADMHSLDFRLGTSLVAHVDGVLAGFLFGFYKFGAAPLPPGWETHLQAELRLESQTLGVLPEYRGMRLAHLLKIAQAEHARADGIDLVNWTADPLQYPNAVLNFGLLRAVAFDFHADYYPFRNDLNRVPASRLELTWLVNSARVRNVPDATGRSLVLDLSHQPDLPRLNDGVQLTGDEPNAPLVAIEIPANWTELQQHDLDHALRWRDATDHLFARYVGRAPGYYVITGVGVHGERRYLIGQQATLELFDHLAHVE